MNFIYTLSDKQKNNIIIVLLFASLLLLIYIFSTYKNNIYESNEGNTCSSNMVVGNNTTISKDINDFTTKINDQLDCLNVVIYDISFVSILPIKFSIKETNPIAYNQNTTITVGGQIPNVELTLNLPRSVPGAQGETGITGTPGSIGDIGPIGKKGPMGYWGSQ